MSQNLINLVLTDEQIATARAALDQLETALSGLISLSAEERRSLTRMGPKSEAFVRQTLSVLDQNPQVVPPSVDVGGARVDLAALERLRPMLDRLERLAERGQDTETALGSDLMNVALEGYAILRVAGRNQGLDSLRKELSTRFSRTRRAEGETGTPA